MFSPQSEKKCVDSPALAQRVVRYDLLLHSNTRKLWNLSIRSTLCMTPFNATINQVSWATFLPLFFGSSSSSLFFWKRGNLSTRACKHKSILLSVQQQTADVWVFKCWATLCCFEDSKKVNTWRNFFPLEIMHAAFFCFLFCLPSFFSTFLFPNLLCKWPQPNSQRIMGVNC